MNHLEKIVHYSLSVFDMAILVKINDKIVVINPTLLKTLSIDEIAKSLSKSDLTEDEIIEGIQIIDNARSDKK